MTSPTQSQANAALATLHADLIDPFSVLDAYVASHPDVIPATPPAITTASLPNGTVGTAYSAALNATGTAPLTFTATGLPAGLSMSSAGVITGTPSAAAVNSVIVTVHDGNSPSLTASATLGITVGAAAPSAPVITAVPPVLALTVGQATTMGPFVATGTAPITWTALGLPAGLTLSSSGTISGIPTTVGTSSVMVTAHDGNSPSLSATVGFGPITVSAAPVATPTAPVYWLRFGSTQPTHAQIDDAVTNHKIRGILLKCEFKDAANYAKARALAAGYNIEIFAYKSLMDARSNAASLGADQPTMVSYAEAQAGGWLTGHVMGGYTYQEVVTTWSASYQQKASDNAMAWLQDPQNSAFTGLFLDNLVAPGTDYYSTGQNEAQLSGGCLAVIQKLGPLAAAIGKKLMPNITDGRITPGFFAAGSAPGGAGFDEMFMAWPNDNLNTGPASQIDEGAVPGVFYAHSNGTTRKTAVWGLAGLWCSGEVQNGGAFYSCAQDDYDASLYWYPEYAMQLGTTTTGGYVTQGSLIYRVFTGGIAIINTSGSAQSLTLPFACKQVDGTNVSGSYSVPALSGALLTKV